MVSINYFTQYFHESFGVPGVTTYGRAVDLATGKCQADDRAAFLAAYYLSGRLNASLTIFGNDSFADRSGAAEFHRRWMR